MSPIRLHALVALLIPSLTLGCAGRTRAEEGEAPVSIALPGGAPVSMDYLAYDATNDRVWIPAGNTGNVNVLDVQSGSLSAIEGFGTSAVKGRDGKERQVGPSSAAVGDGFVFVGNRAGAKLCAVDAKSLEKKGCLTLSSSPDGTAFVAATHEVWVTLPREKSIAIIDARDPAALKLSVALPVDGPEGYAVDQERSLFYTNLEDRDQTLVFDARTRKLLATWPSGCGTEGPRGLALDGERRQLFVACARGKVRTLDASKDGALLGEFEAGAGLDNIDYLQSKRLLYAAGGKAGTLTIGVVTASGEIRKVASLPGVSGGKVVVVDSLGAAYIADSKGGRLVVLKLPPM